jgi:hypothetical protein
MIDAEFEGREDDDLIRDEDHDGLAAGEAAFYGPTSRLVQGLPHQIRDPMKRADRPVQERAQLHPQSVDAALRRVHPLAVQAPIAVDPVMSMTFCTHVASVAAAGDAGYAACEANQHHPFEACPWLQKLREAAERSWAA